MTHILSTRPAVFIVNTFSQREAVKVALQSKVPGGDDLHMVPVVLYCKTWPDKATRTPKHTFSFKHMWLCHRGVSVFPKVPPFILFRNDHDWLTITLRWAFQLFGLMQRGNMHQWVVTLSDTIDAAATLLARFDNTSCIHAMYHTSDSSGVAREKHSQAVHDTANSLMVPWPTIENSIKTCQEVVSQQRADHDESDEEEVQISAVQITAASSASSVARASPSTPRTPRSKKKSTTPVAQSDATTSSSTSSTSPSATSSSSSSSSSAGATSSGQVRKTLGAARKRSRQDPNPVAHASKKLPPSS